MWNLGSADNKTQQIMDGSPSRGETIPIRLFLGGFDLTPTFRDVNKKFSTRYYLSLVLIDEGKSIHLVYPEPLVNLLVVQLSAHHEPISRCEEVLQTVRNHTIPTSPRTHQWRRARCITGSSREQDHDSASCTVKNVAGANRCPHVSLKKGALFTIV